MRILVFGDPDFSDIPYEDIEFVVLEGTDGERTWGYVVRVTSIQQVITLVKNAHTVAIGYWKDEDA